MSWHGPIRGGRFSPMIWTGTLAGNAGRSVRKDRLAGSRSNCCNAMQSDEQIENDHKCPNTGTLLQDAVTGAVFMGVASFWSVGASWLSAHLVISVDAELISYWFAIPTVLLGAALYTQWISVKQSVMPTRLRHHCILCSLIRPSGLAFMR